MQIIRGKGREIVKSFNLDSRLSIWPGGIYREIIEKGWDGVRILAAHTSRGESIAKGTIGVAELAKIATPPPLLSDLSFLVIRLNPGIVILELAWVQVSCKQMIWGFRVSEIRLREALLEDRFGIFHWTILRLIESLKGIGLSLRVASLWYHPYPRRSQIL